MVTALLGFIGTSAGGAFFGFISTLLQRKSELALKKEERLHVQTLAANKQLEGYLQSLVNSGPDNSFSRTIEYVIGVLALTVCYAVGICFTFPETLILTLNPEQIPNKISFLFGLISWERTSNEVIQISAGGVGLMLCYPIVFILSSVCTGVVSRKIR